MPELLAWLGIAALSLCAAVFSAMEAAFLQLSPARLAEMERDGDRSGPRLQPIAADKPRYVNLALFMQILLSAFAVVWASFTVVNRHGGDFWIGALVALGTAFVMFVIVGVGGRTLGQQRPYKVASATAWLARGLDRIVGFIPRLLIVVGNAITPGKGFRQGPFSTEAELLEVVDLAERGGVVEKSERRMIESVFGLGDTIAREVMVPRTEMVWIEASKTVRQALALALRSGFSRVPVIGEHADDVVGIAYLKDLAARVQDPREEERPVLVGEVVRPPVFVPDSKPVDDLLREMQAARVHVAVVVDEYGGTAGLVTIEDILEEIVGEIADEYDRETAPLERRADGSLLVSARLTVDDLCDELGVHFPDDEIAGVDTVAGLMAHRMGRVPIPGGSMEYQGFRFTAQGQAGRRHRVESVVVEPISVGSDGPSSEAGTAAAGDAPWDQPGDERADRRDGAAVGDDTEGGTARAPEGNAADDTAGTADGAADGTAKGAAG